MRLARVAFIVVGGDDDRGELLQAAGSQSALSLDAGWNDHHTSDAFPRTAPFTASPRRRAVHAPPSLLTIPTSFANIGLTWQDRPSLADIYIVVVNHVKPPNVDNPPRRPALWSAFLSRKLYRSDNGGDQQSTEAMSARPELTWISSIRRMRATVSVASSIALVETNKGCKTFSSRMFEIKPCSKVVQSVDATQYDTRH